MNKVAPVGVLFAGNHLDAHFLHQASHPSSIPVNLAKDEESLFKSLHTKICFLAMPKLAFTKNKNYITGYY